MYKLERHKPCFYTVNAFLFCGQIPKDFKKSTLFCFHTYNFILKILFLTWNCLAPFLHLVVSVRGKKKVDISDDIASTYGSFNEMLVIGLVTLKWKEWSILLHDMTKETEFGRHPDYDKLVKLLNRFTSGCITYVFIMIMTYGIGAFFDSPNCRRINEENNLHEMCGTLYTVWFEGDSAMLSTSILILQVLLMLCTGIPSASTTLLVLETAELLISHVNNLKRYFVAAFDVPSSEETRDRLRFCLSYHNYIIELATRLNRLVKYTCGITSVLSAVAFSFLANQAFNGNVVGAVLYLLGYLATLLALCHAGQRIVSETFTIKDAVYDSKWYEADVNDIKDLPFIIARCQIPLSLETFPLGSLDYAFFMLIVKTAYSYFTLLRETA